MSRLNTSMTYGFSLCSLHRFLSDHFVLIWLSKVLDINLRAQIVANRAQVQAMLLPKEQLSARVYEAPDMGENEKSRRINKAKNFKGSIVNFSSVTGLKSFDGIVGSYTVSKHGMIGLTRAMATQYGPAGIRTNAVCPGCVFRDSFSHLTSLTEILKVYFDPSSMERSSWS